MRFRNLLLAAMATVSIVVAAAFAQTDKHAHDHGSGKSVDSKEPGEAAKQEMTAKDLKARLDKGDKVIVIDARHELGGQILKGAIHVPSDKLEDWARDADKSAVIVTYCTCPHDEAAEAEVRSLLQMGFKNAYSLKGGMDAARGVGIESCDSRREIKFHFGGFNESKDHLARYGCVCMRDRPDRFSIEPRGRQARGL